MKSQFIDFIARVMTEIKDPLVRILRVKAEEFEDANEARKLREKKEKEEEEQIKDWWKKRKEEQAYKETYAKRKELVESSRYSWQSTTGEQLQAIEAKLENVINLDQRISKIVNEALANNDYGVVNIGLTTAKDDVVDNELVWQNIQHKDPEDIDLDEFDDTNKYVLTELYNPEAYAKCGNVCVSTVVIDLWCRLNTDNEGDDYLGKEGMDRLREAILLILDNPATPPKILLAENYVSYDADIPASYPACAYMCLKELRHLIYRFPNVEVESYDQDDVRKLFKKDKEYPDVL
tara:strand:- start:1073 stop:1948 length:876 start_codon:yes stop_codon:yes gene_type:complete